MATLQQSKKAVTMAVAQHHGCTQGLVYAHVVCEILSHCLVLVVAWVTTAYVIAPYFLAHYVLALLGSDLHWWQLSPLLWLFPPGTGRLVAPSQGGRLGPMTFRALSWCLRLAVLGWMVWALVTVLHQETGRVDCTKSHDCDGLPPWLQAWWSQQPSCPVTGHSYTKCLQETPWYGRGCCNVSAGACYRFSSSAWLQPVAVVVPLMFGSFLALPASMLLSAMLCCRAGPLGTVRVGRVNMGSKDESEDVTAFDRFMFFGLGLFPFVLEVFLDLNGIVQYILTGNFQFALVSTSIFAMSVITQLRRSVLQKFWQAAIESMHCAHATDDLEVIMLSKRSVESATQLMLQYYAFAFVTSREFAIGSFLFSMVVKLKGVADAVYDLTELDLYHITMQDVKKTT